MTRNKFPLELDQPTHIHQLAKEVAESLGLRETLSKHFLLAAFTAAQVFDYKQAKYGPGNIAEFAETGVMIRCTDKVKRIANLWRKGETPTDESIEDSWGDLANYGLISLMCRWGMWPGVEAAKARAPKRAPQYMTIDDACEFFGVIYEMPATKEHKLAALKRHFADKAFAE